MSNKNSLKVTINDLCLIKPMTKTQERILKDWEDSDVLVLYGCAGTGKTFIPMYKAFEVLLQGNKGYDRVIGIRSAVEARTTGFKPGTEEEKAAPFEEVFEATCNVLFNKPNAYTLLQSQKKFFFKLTGNLRGLTFDDSIIIIDECQNMSYQELRTIITRAGLNTKVVFCGDTKQNDLDNKSGFSHFLDILSDMNGVSMYQFTVDDIVRGGIVKDFIIAEENYEN